MIGLFHWPARLKILAIFFLFIQFSCSVNKFRKPITNFQTATTVVTAHTNSVMTELNRIQRNRMIIRHQQENKPIFLRDIKASYLIQPEDLKVRLDALKNLNEYVDLLIQIANSDAPEQIAKSATSLSDALNNLTTTVTGLPIEGDAKFTTAFTTASPFIADILNIVAQKKIRHAVQTAILTGEKPINDLIAAIGDDLEVVFIHRKANLEEDRVDLLSKYNKEVGNTPKNEIIIEQLSREIMVHEDVMDELVNANPRSALKAMAKAHSKLIAYAHYNTPGTFAEVIEAIEIFSAVSKKLGDAAMKLKNQNS